MARRIISLVLSFGMLFQQISFAQVAVELNLANHLAMMSSGLKVEKFRPIHLRYFSYDSLNDNFKLLLDKGDAKNQQSKELESSTKVLLEYFLVGVSLPDSAFWVNLRPDAEDQVIDQYLEKTDVGKIMLEADLQLKKDTASMTSPSTPEGKAYWNKLYKKASEIYGYDSVTIPTLTRPWIVPGEIILRETQGNQSTPSAYIYKANLKVMLEQDYLKSNSQTSSQYSFADPRAKALNEYSSELIRELIIPKLTKEVNSSKRYASLRQVYYSLILSRWFKLRFTGKTGTYASLINTSDISNLISKPPWSKDTYFKAYQKSFTDGEYSIQEPVYTPTGQVIRSYFSGGIQMASSAISPSSFTNTKVMPNELLNAGLLIEGDNTGLKTAASPINYKELFKNAGLNHKLIKELIDSRNLPARKNDRYQDTSATTWYEGYLQEDAIPILRKIFKDEPAEKLVIYPYLIHSLHIDDGYILSFQSRSQLRYSIVFFPKSIEFNLEPTLWYAHDKIANLSAREAAELVKQTVKVVKDIIKGSASSAITKSKQTDNKRTKEIKEEIENLRLQIQRIQDDTTSNNDKIKQEQLSPAYYSPGYMGPSYVRELRAQNERNASAIFRIQDHISKLSSELSSSPLAIENSPYRSTASSALAEAISKDPKALFNLYDKIIKIKDSFDLILAVNHGMSDISFDNIEVVDQVGGQLQKNGLTFSEAAYVLNDGNANDLMYIANTRNMRYGDGQCKFMAQESGDMYIARHFEDAVIKAILTANRLPGYTEEMQLIAWYLVKTVQRNHERFFYGDDKTPEQEVYDTARSIIGSTNLDNLINKISDAKIKKIIQGTISSYDQKAIYSLISACKDAISLRRNYFYTPVTYWFETKETIQDISKRLLNISASSSLETLGVLNSAKGEHNFDKYVRDYLQSGNRIVVYEGGEQILILDKEKAYQKKRSEEGVEYFEVIAAKEGTYSSTEGTLNFVYREQSGYLHLTIPSLKEGFFIIKLEPMQASSAVEELGSIKGVAEKIFAVPDSVISGKNKITVYETKEGKQDTLILGLYSDGAGLRVPEFVVSEKDNVSTGSYILRDKAILKFIYNIPEKTLNLESVNGSYRVALEPITGASATERGGSLPDRQAGAKIIGGNSVEEQITKLKELNNEDDKKINLIRGKIDYLKKHKSLQRPGEMFYLEQDLTRLTEDTVIRYRNIKNLSKSLQDLEKAETSASSAIEELAKVDSASGSYRAGVSVSNKVKSGEKEIVIYETVPDAKPNKILVLDAEGVNKEKSLQGLELDKLPNLGAVMGKYSSDYSTAWIYYSKDTGYLEVTIPPRKQGSFSIQLEPVNASATERGGSARNSGGSSAVEGRSESNLLIKEPYFLKPYISLVLKSLDQSGQYTEGFTSGIVFQYIRFNSGRDDAYPYPMDNYVQQIDTILFEISKDRDPILLPKDEEGKWHFVQSASSTVDIITIKQVLSKMLPPELQQEGSIESLAVFIGRLSLSNQDDLRVVVELVVQRYESTLDLVGEENKIHARNEVLNMLRDTEGIKQLIQFKRASKEEASSAVEGETPKTTGGIDFRALPMAIQPMGSFKGLTFNLPHLTQAELDKVNIAVEMQQIKNMVQSGILPSGDRIKELVVACMQKGETNSNAASLLLCLADILKLEEENASESSPELREALVIVDSIS
jgi:hypothetical protein